MKIVSISDTHCQLDKINLPDGDLLIHAGDLTYRGTIKEVSRELYLLQELSSKFKYGAIFICGNHDWLGEKDPDMLSFLVKGTNLKYLQDSEIVIEGIKIYGSPYQPEFGGWAFNLSRFEGELLHKWSMIPDDTQILITHGPPKNIRDLTLGHEIMTPYGMEIDPPQHVGCYDLKNRVEQLKDLRLHVFGHIHSAYGVTEIGKTKFVNASICNEKYQPVNAPIIVDL